MLHFSQYTVVLMRAPGTVWHTCKQKLFMKVIVHTVQTQSTKILRLLLSLICIFNKFDHKHVFHLNIMTSVNYPHYISMIIKNLVTTIIII